MVATRDPPAGMAAILLLVKLELCEMETCRIGQHIKTVISALPVWYKLISDAGSSEPDVLLRCFITGAMSRLIRHTNRINIKYLSKKQR